MIKYVVLTTGRKFVAEGTLDAMKELAKTNSKYFIIKKPEIKRKPRQLKLPGVV